MPDCKLRSLAVPIALTALSAPAAADSIDLNLNGDAARFTYERPVASQRLLADAGYLHHQDRGNVINLSVHRAGEAGGATQPVRAGLGGRLFFLDPDVGSDDGFALGIGGFVRFQLSGYDRIGFAAHAYLAPDVLAFGDAEQAVEVAGRISYAVIREADIYLGVRYIKAEFPGRDVRFDTGLHVGVQLRF